jgi:Cys-tRNA(Pro) deacylase
MLEDHGISYSTLEYVYEEKGGTRLTSECLGVPENQIIKTLVMENENKAPLLVLMHGDREVSTKALARHIGCKSVKPCDARDATRHTNYVFGGTNPFGTRKPLPVYVERSIMDLPWFLINGGRRGLQARISPEALNILHPIYVDASQETNDLSYGSLAQGQA